MKVIDRGSSTSASQITYSTTLSYDCIISKPFSTSGTVIIFQETGKDQLAASLGTRSSYHLLEKNHHRAKEYSIGTQNSRQGGDLIWFLSNKRLWNWWCYKNSRSGYFTLLLPYLVEINLRQLNYFKINSTQGIIVQVNFIRSYRDVYVKEFNLLVLFQSDFSTVYTRKLLS